jgi:hypothetical protein
MRWLLVLAVACNGGQDSDSTPFAAADADADTDTDTDTDADEWSSIDGLLTYELRVEGEPLCDATIEFTGTPYVGPCPECDFLFEVTGTVVRDDGNGACPFIGPLSIHDNTIIFDDPMLIGFASEVSYNGEMYYDAFMAGGDSLYYGIYVRPITGGSDKDYGTATVTGDSFAWTFSETKGKPDWEYYLYPYYFAQCRYPVYSYAVAPYAPGHTTYETLPCDYAQADVFSFHGEDGGTADITVDTTDEHPLDLGIVVYSPEQCVDGIAYDNFECSNGASECASLRLDTVAGIYLLVVEQFNTCDVAGPFDYRLDIDASWDPEVSQVHDDVSNEERPATLEVTGTATLK